MANKRKWTKKYHLQLIVLIDFPIKMRKRCLLFHYLYFYYVSPHVVAKETNIFDFYCFIGIQGDQICDYK